MLGPAAGRVVHIAPAGTSDSFDSHSSATQPEVTCRTPTPASSTCMVYAHPRSTAVAEGVSTKNNRGGAVIVARISPRVNCNRYSVGREDVSRKREPGDNSTSPIEPTRMRAREDASVSRRVVQKGVDVFIAEGGDEASIESMLKVVRQAKKKSS